MVVVVKGDRRLDRVRELVKVMFEGGEGVEVGLVDKEVVREKGDGVVRFKERLGKDRGWDGRKFGGFEEVRKLGERDNVVFELGREDRGDGGFELVNEVIDEGVVREMEGLGLNEFRWRGMRR